MATAAADLSSDHANVRLLCTSGTPAASEIAAIGRVAGAGWRVAVRADFDQAGLAHVAALLKGVPGAVPWRMGLDDYLASLAAARDQVEAINRTGLPPTPWDPRLSLAMREQGIAAYEETLLPRLLDDLRCGLPQEPPSPTPYRT